MVQSNSIAAHREKQISPYFFLQGARVLVTGGLGFIGQNLVRALVEKEAGVTVIDNCENSSPEALADVMDRIKFIQGSVLDTALIKRVVQYDYIFHLACIQIAHSAQDPVADLKVNAQSTLEMLEYLRQSPGRLKRFVYPSSASVYGSANNFPCKEDGPVQMLSHYASTKFLGEQYTRMYHSLYKLPTVALRYSNVYGPGQTPANPYCGVIGKFITNALERKPLLVYGNGSQTRDYTFVADAVAATLTAAGSVRSMGGLYNVGTGRETSVLDLARVIESLEGPQQIRHIPERAIDNIHRRCMDIRKITHELQWAPATELKDGIATTLAWYRTPEPYMVEA